MKAFYFVKYQYRRWWLFDELINIDCLKSYLYIFASVRYILCMCEKYAVLITKIPIIQRWFLLGTLIDKNLN